MYTRRDFGRLALATMPAIAAFGKVSSKLHGVEFGVAGYSYNSLPRQGLIDAVIQSMVDCGIGQCLLYGPSTEPVELADKARPARGGFGGARGGSGGRGAGGGRGGSGAGRGGGRGPASPEQAAALEQLHQWHLTVKLDYYTAIRKKFADAGLVITGYDATSDIGTNNADEDLNRACEVTQALGAKCMMCAITKPVAKRLAPIADKHALKVGLQGRPNMNSTNGDAMATPSDFGDVMAYSKNFGSSIDVGDATGGGWDVVKFVEDTHPRVFGLNLKDRTKANMSMPWGEGDTHIDKILQFVRDKKYPVRCYIDCDYQTPEGGTRQADVKRCFEYAKKALA